MSDQNDTSQPKGPWFPRTGIAGVRFVQDSIPLLQSNRLSPAWAMKLQQEIDRIKSGERVLHEFTDPWDYLCNSQA